MNRTVLAAFSIGCLAFSSLATQASTIVPTSQYLTVDSDGDGTADYLDNAPGAANPFQEDSDADQIGDAIDPTPSTSVPNLGDPGLLLGPAAPIPAGNSGSFNYLVVLATPPGGWGRIELDFGLDLSVDAIYFGPLTSITNAISVPASLYVSSNWDLNTPGNYSVGMKAYGPGMYSQNWAQSVITVLPVPEPSAVVLAGLGAIAVGIAARRRSRKKNR